MNSTEAVLSDGPVARFRPRAGSARRLPGLLVTGLCLGYALGAALGWGAPGPARFMGDFGLAGAALAAALSCLVRGCTLTGHTRLAWLLFGLSSLMVAVGNSTWGWYEVVLDTRMPDGSLAQYAFLLFAPLAIAGLMVLAQRPRTPATWLCLLLDGWLVAGSLFTLGWSLALGQTAHGASGDPLRVAFALGYPVLDILLVSLVVGLRFRCRDGNLTAVHTAMVGLAVTVICDALFTTPQLHSSYHSGDLLDAGWFAGSVLLAWAPWSPQRPGRDQQPSAASLPRRRVASTFSALTPYVAAAVCAAGIIYNALDGCQLDRVVLAATATVGLALILRQGVMLLDNLSLAQELATKEAHFRSLVQGSSDVIMIAGTGGVLSYVSPAARGVYGRDPAELVGGHLLNLVHPEDAERVLAEVHGYLARADGAGGEPSRRVECRIRSGGGEWLHVESTLNRHRDGVILNSRDVTERVTLQAQLHHNAFHDPLTDLPNRALFVQRLREALRSLPERAGEPTVAVLFLDLDGFKAVNDSAGHQVGDELLVQAARRLQRAVRTKDTVARFGGDEFAVLVCGRLGRTQVQELAERVRAALGEPYRIGGAELGVAASIGIAFGPCRQARAGDVRADDTQAEAATDELMRNADLAMYQAKAEGKGRVMLYTSAMRAALERRGEQEERLRVAVREGGFSLLHQPVIDLATGAVTAVEAQARWRSPQGLLLTPAEVLDGVEQGEAATGFARWLLREAVTAAAARGAVTARPGTAPVPVSIRLSGERVCAPGMYEAVVAALRESGLPADRLLVELAGIGPDESADELGRRLAALRRLGVAVALAGFGAGGGSLRALARLPLDAVKLDRGLVHDLAGSALTRMLAGHALRLGRDLGLVTGADGVDHRRQVSVLQELGCRQGQGLAFVQPLDEHRLRRALVRWTHPLPRPLGTLASWRGCLEPHPCAEGPAAGLGAPRHGSLDLPEQRPVCGPATGPHGETAVPPA